MNLFTNFKLSAFVLSLVVFFACTEISLAQTANYNSLSLAQRIHLKETTIGETRINNGEQHILSLPEQDCNSAIPVCQQVYFQAAAYSGIGNLQEIPLNSSCLGSQEKNSVWYSFTINSSGTLLFEIDPVSFMDDYDFALYDISGKNCSDIPSGNASEVSCNYSAIAGSTGLQIGQTINSQPASGSNQNAPINAIIGQTYVLVVSNYSSSQNGYTLNFSGTATLVDNTSPVPQSVVASCGQNVFTVQMSEAVRCSSVAMNGSDFSIAGPGGPFTVSSANAINCGVSSSQIELHFSPLLQAGQTYTLTINNGSDGNTLTDNCGNDVIANSSVTFTNVSMPASITGATSLCIGNPTSLVASAGTSWLWMPGGATTQSITISPSVSTNYSVTITTNSCPTTNTTHSVTVKGSPTSNFTVSSNSICLGQSVTFQNTSTLGQNCVPFIGCTNNQTIATWDFGDGQGAVNVITNSSTDIKTHSFSSAGTYIVALQMSDINGCADTTTATVSVNLVQFVTASANVFSVCFGDSIILTGGGSANPYSWTNGVIDGVAFAPDSSDTFVVTGTDNNGCIDTASVAINVNSLPIVTTNASLSVPCVGSLVTLNGIGASSYTWNNGVIDGLAFVLQADGYYTVTGVDTNGCVAMDSVALSLDNTCQSVWPGDANNDGLANNLDILELGVRYASAGGQRIMVDNSWYGMDAPNWGTDTVSTGYNLNHADCDGNGFVDLDDTLAVNLNYGLSHALRPSIASGISTVGDIYFGSPQAVYGNSELVEVDVFLGKNTNPLINFYGAAFTLNYTDNSLIQPGSMMFSIDDVSWVGTINSNGIRLTRPNETSQSIYGAICRTNHSTVSSGFGKIGTLRFMTTANNVNADFVLSASNSFYIDSVGNQTPLTSATYSVNISSSVGLQQQVSSLGASIYPNPNNGTFTLNGLNPKEEYLVEVVDVLGRIIYTQQIKNSNAKTILKLDDAAGVYWLQLSTKHAKQVCKIVVE